VIRQVDIAGRYRIGGGNPLVFIAGPCVLESEELAFAVAAFLSSLADRLSIPVIFKGSFDKANRSSLRSYRGPGEQEGLKILAEVKSRYGLPVTTDVHEPRQVSPAAKVVDILQIPAFLCRQTDLIVAAGETGLPVNIKKGQFMAPWDMGNAVEKGFRHGEGDLVRLSKSRRRLPGNSRDPRGDLPGDLRRHAQRAASGRCGEHLLGGKVLHHPPGSRGRGGRRGRPVPGDPPRTRTGPVRRAEQPPPAGRRAAGSVPAGDPDGGGRGRG